MTLHQTISIRLGIAVCVAFGTVATFSPAQDQAEAPGVGITVDQPGHTSPEPHTIGADLAADMEQMILHIPDPELDRHDVDKWLDQARQKGESAAEAYLERITRRIATIQQENKVALSLEDVLQRTLANNFSVQMERYNPAVETTRLVEAQARFDAEFYSEIYRSKTDSPKTSQLEASQAQQFMAETGIRKLLPTGAQISGYYSTTRQQTDSPYQTLNPAWRSTFALELGQPLLKRFGLDYNRSLIVIAHNDKRISEEAFRRMICQTLYDTERLYWNLMAARRILVIAARDTADYEAIFDNVKARFEADFDITHVQLEATRADLEQSLADFLERRSDVLRAQNALLAVMNDPDLPTGQPVEIITTSFPDLHKLVLDPAGEVQIALENRPEIREQELRISSANVAMGQAKNEQLPQLDLTFRYIVNGIGANADQSFNEATRHNFVDYEIGMMFEFPIGNRAPRAAYRRAQLQHAQAVAGLKATMEDVIRDVHDWIISLDTRFNQIPPAYQAALARERELQSLVAREERRDYNTLKMELGNVQSLASARQILLTTITQYALAIAELERAKGTLLEYNNIVIAPIGE